MRILYVTRAAPIPNGRGVDRRSAQHLAALQKLGTVTMLLSEHAARRAAEYGLDLNKLGLERLWVRDEPTAVDRSHERFWRETNPILRRIQNLRVRHDSDQRALPADAARWREAIGGGFDLLFAFRMASAVWADSVMGGGSRPRLSIVDLDDIESIAFRRISAETRLSRLERIQVPLHTHWLRKTEARLARTWDGLCVCSQIDADTLAGLFGCRALVVPNAVEFPEISPSANGDRFGLLFVGTLDYPPNSVGIRWFVDQVWPRLRARLGERISLNIIGMDPPPEVVALADGAGIEVLGRVENLTPFYAEASLVIVPIFSGGGTRIKLIEALAHSRPVVTTSLGCEGLSIKHGQDALVADTPEEFAQVIIRLADDAKLREQVGANGWRMGKSAFDSSAIETRFIEQITALAASRGIAPSPSAARSGG